MKENALIVRPLDIIKVYVDFSDIDNIYKAIDAKRVSTIHTKKTQEISELLGIHLMGFVDREGNDINNDKACHISGYDYLGSFMLLCKADDKLNALPFTEKELECVYTYLTEGKILTAADTNGAEEFFKRYPINPPLLNISLKPKYYWREDIPYVLLARYDLAEATDKQLEELGLALFELSSRMIAGFKDIRNGVHRSPDGDYYINCLMESGQAYNILIEAVWDDEDDEDKVIIYNAKDVIHIGFLNDAVPEKEAHHQEDMETTPEEAYEPGDYEDDEDETEEMMNYIVEMDVDIDFPQSKRKNHLKGKYCYPLFCTALGESVEEAAVPVAGKLFKLINFNPTDEVAEIEVLKDKKLQLKLNEEAEFKLNHIHKNLGKMQGFVRFVLKYYKIAENCENHTIMVEDKMLEMETRKEVDSAFGSLELLTPKKEEGVIEVCDNIYQIFIFNEEGMFAVIDSMSTDNEENEHYYYPVSASEANISELSFQAEEHLRLFNIIKIYFKRGNKKKKKDLDMELPNNPYGKKDPLDDVKYPKIDINTEIKDPLDDVQ